jgi:hypothetical protein
MNNEISALALQIAQILGEWRFLRRDQIAKLLPDESLPLDPLLGEVAGGEVIRLEAAAQDPAARPSMAWAGLTKLRRRSVVGPLFLQHTLAVNDVRLSFLRSAQAYP